MAGKKVSFYTLGCKLNFSETSTLAQLFQERGFERVRFGVPADVCVINTCTVTAAADKKSRQTVNKALHNSPGAFIIVTGCYAQLCPEKLPAFSGIDLVIGISERFNLFDYAGDFTKKDQPMIVLSDPAEQKVFIPSCSYGDRVRSFLKIQDGCDYHCSFCTIPLARGRSRNGSIDELAAQAEKIANMGCREIVLTGINIGDFGKTTGETLINLIRRFDCIKGIERFRISSIEPDLLTEEIMAFVAQSQKFMPHFHIPLQSGSDKTLQRMNRRYRTDLYRQRVITAKTLMPYACIGADVIAGTPGESETDFDETCQFIRNLDISYLHVFTYSERQNTKASMIKESVPVCERKRRSKILHEIADTKRHDFYKHNLNRTVNILCESAIGKGKMCGFTENYIKTEIPGDKKLINRIVKAKLCDITGSGTMNAEIIKGE